MSPIPLNSNLPPRGAETTALRPLTPVSPATPRLLSQLQVGQILNATVMKMAGSGTQREALLNLAGNNLSVRTSHNLHPGQTLTLRVDRLGPQVELKMLGSRPATPQLLQGGLRQVLPQTLGASSVGQALNTLFNQSRPATAAGQLSGSPVAAAGQTAGGSQGTPTANLPATLFSNAPMPLRAALTALLTGANVPQPAQPLPAAPPPPAGTPPPALATPLPAAVMTALDSIHRPPPLSSLQQSGMLQSAVLQSGLFAEAKLARGKVDGGDLKMQLMRAAAQLKTLHTAQSLQMSRAQSRGAPAERAMPQGAQTGAQMAAASAAGQTAASLLESALAHIGSQQIRTALQQLQGQAFWLLELPFTHKEETRSIKVAIDGEEQDADEATGRRWRVDFSFDLPELGPIFVNLTLHGERLNTRLFIDREATRSMAQGQLPVLDQQLRQAGFETGHMDVFPGPPPASFQERLEAAIRDGGQDGLSLRA